MRGKDGRRVAGLAGGPKQGSVAACWGPAPPNPPAGSWQGTDAAGEQAEEGSGSGGTGT